MKTNAGTQYTFATCANCGIEITLSTKFARPAVWTHAPVRTGASGWYLHCRLQTATPGGIATSPSRVRDLP